MPFQHSPCPSSRKIIIAEGSMTIVPGVGYAKVDPLLTLKIVPHVPRMSKTSCQSKVLLKIYIAK